VCVCVWRGEGGSGDPTHKPHTHTHAPRILTHPLIEYSLLQPRSAPEGAPLRPTPGAALHKDTYTNSLSVREITPKGRNPPRIPLYTPMLSFCFRRCLQHPACVCVKHLLTTPRRESQHAAMCSRRRFTKTVYSSILFNRELSHHRQHHS